MKSTPSPQDQEIFKLLEALKSVKAKYPPELLAKRRTAFMVQLALSEKFSVQNFRPPENEKIIEILENLKSVRAEYPSMLMAKQRAAFLSQASKRRRVGWIETLRSAIQSKLVVNPKALAVPMTNEIRIQFIVASILAVACVGILLYGNRDLLMALTRSHPTGGEVSQSSSIVPTATYETTKTTCKPDSPSAQCLTHGFVKGPDPASWVSNSTDNWIKIDTGQAATIHMVELDRVRLDNSTEEFTIAVALSDNQYKEVYDSRTDNYTGFISGPDTIQVSFEPVLARYVKVTVTDPGMTINEVRAFAVVQPPPPDQVIEDTQEPLLPTVTASNIPLPTKTTPPRTVTPVPTRTPTATPTNTPTRTPTATSTNTPTRTPTATSTNTPVPTNTPLPTNTPAPTNTPLPTNTPAPTNTPLPTNTPAPTNTPLPTSTPVPTEANSPSLDTQG
jgi:hypothetical protein